VILPGIDDEVLARLAGTDPWDGSCHRTAGVALSGVEDKAALVSALVAAVEDEGPAERTLAWRFLAMLAQTEAGLTEPIGEAVVAASRSGSIGPTDKEAAVGILAFCSSDSAWEVLVGLAGDPDPVVRRKVAIFLNQMDAARWEQTRALLIALSADPDPAVRDGAAFTLAEAATEDRLAREALRPLLSDDDPWTRAEARRGLGMPPEVADQPVE